MREQIEVFQLPRWGYGVQRYMGLVLACLHWLEHQTTNGKRERRLT
jgi:hypothetical protein